MSNIYNEIFLDNHAIIEASAGTGKTYTITKLVIRILTEKRPDLSEIAVMTFTRKAAFELKKRIREELENYIIKSETEDEYLKNIRLDFEKLNISTIHGFCSSLLNEYRFDFGIPAHYTVNNYIPVESIINEVIISEFPKIFKTIDSSEIIKEINIKDFIKYLKNIENNFSPYKANILEVGKLRYGKFPFPSKDYKESFSIDELAEAIENNPNAIIELLLFYTSIRVKEKIEQYKTNNEILTDDDLTEKVLNGILKFTNLRDEIANKFKYIIVDEFQDTDLTQWLIIHTLMKKNENNGPVVFLVGDPKQSIYRFREGDVNVYRLAKETIKSLQGKEYVLDVNYRSNEELIDFFNTLFENDWFLSSNTQIRYTAVKANNKKQLNIENFNAVNIIKITGNTSGETLKEWNNFVLKAIITLSKEYNVKLKDIMILCSTNEKCHTYEELLLSHNVNAKFYSSQGNLFKQTEAITIKILLLSLAFPNNVNYRKKLLISEIFDIPFKELNEKIENMDDNINKFLNKWELLANEKKWELLFDSLFFEYGLFDKILNKHGKVKGRNILSNYMLLSQIVKDMAYQSNITINKLAIDFSLMIENKRNTNEQMTWINEEDDGVKIMTVHGAKGLESEIVFIGDFGSNKGKETNYKSIVSKLLHDDKNDFPFYRTIINHTEREGTERNKKEDYYENRRRFYVALTRAKEMIFIPYAITKRVTGALEAHKEDENKNGWFINQINNCEIKQEYYKDKDDLPLTTKENYKTKEDKIEMMEKGKIDEKIWHRRSYLSSFSSIMKKHNEFDNHIIELSKYDEEENEDILPGGTKTGILLHGILEKIDYEKVNKTHSVEDIIPLINPFLDEVNIDDENIKAEISRLIFNVLKAKIIDKNVSFSEIPNTKRKHEAEFYLKISEKMYLVGITDLIFEYKGKYYIVDWKSNILPEYKGETFENYVLQHYELQYKIYTVALYEYLSNIIGEFDMKKHFGSILYVFLRGIEDNSDSGIFEIKSNNISIEDYKNFIQNKYEEFLKENE